MIQELLVAIACYKNDGCSTTTSAYYASHTEIKTMMRKSTDNIKNYAGPTVVMLSPTILFIAKGQGTVNINKYLSLQVSRKDGGMLMVKLSF